MLFTCIGYDNPKKKTKLKQLLNTAEKAFKKLFNEKGYKPEDLFKNSEYQALANGTAELFNKAIPHHTPEDLKAYLEEDIFIFSQLKTHTQLTEARQYLKDEKGNIRSYHDFEQKVLKLNKQYNLNYLEAEYEFATHSAMSASNWANLQEDTERYWLEYRTAGDDRVRVSHQALNGVCLPKDDPFWSEFYPPNGWRCRCVATEVLAREKTKSDSQKAIEQGQYATSHIGKNGKNKLAMFRFNPGQNKKVFPPNNAYTKMVGADKVKKESIKSKAKNFFKNIVDKIKLKKVKHNAVKLLDKKLTEEEIISRVGGGDLTRGSCASLSFAYAGNKLGFDVLDFRDGESRSFFARADNIISIATKTNGYIEKQYNDFNAVNKLVTNMKVGKEYILATGGHAAVIKKIKEKSYQYLELQSPTSNGYKPLTMNVLKNRFGCKKSHTSYGNKLTASSILVDIDELNIDGFKELLGYINTPEQEQRKGSKGKTR